MPQLFLDLFHSLFGELQDVALAVLLISVVGAVGVALGELKMRGIGLGVGGVLFAGIAFGHFGAELPPDLLQFIRDFGLILFVYTIGVQVGPGFFESLKKAGLQLNLLAACIVGMSCLIVAALSKVLSIPLPAMLGLYSGAVTNTPSLAAGQQMLAELGLPPEEIASTGTAYAIAYPFGIAGILLAMLLVRFVLRILPQDEATAFEDRRKREAGNIDMIDLLIQNPGFDGIRLGEMTVLQWAGVVPSRLRRGEEVMVPTSDTIIHTGDILHIVGPQEKLKGLVHTIGEVASPIRTERDNEIGVEKLAVTNTAILGKTIAQTGFSSGQNVFITRVNRAGVDLSPMSGLKLQFGDIVTLVGRPKDIDMAAPSIGNSRHKLQHMEVLPLFVGIALGVLLGSLALHLPGMPAPVKLGLAGGPLIMAIFLARIGHIGPYVWFMPPSVMYGLRELGIVMFLAAVGLKAGHNFVDTLLNGDGMLWFGCGIIVTLVPLLIAGFFGRIVMKLNYLTLSGVLAGSMTDPPALAFASAMSHTDAPALAYATVYPLTMCLRILAVQLMGLALWGG